MNLRALNIGALRAELSPRTLAVLLFVGLELGLAVGLLVVWQSVDAAVAERDAAADQLDALQQRQLAHGVGTGKQGGALAPDPTFAAASEPIAVNALQEMVLHRIEESGSTVQSFQAQPSEDEEGHPASHRLRLEASFKTTLEPLQAILFDLETATPFVFVDSLSVQVVKPDSSDTVGVNAQLLRVVLGASGYWRKTP